MTTHRKSKAVAVSMRRMEALKIIERHPRIRASEFAFQFWPNANMHTACSNQGNGACRGKRAWLCAGSYLGKLQKAGGLADYSRIGDSRMKPQQSKVRKKAQESKYPPYPPKCDFFKTVNGVECFIDAWSNPQTGGRPMAFVAAIPRERKIAGCVARSAWADVAIKEQMKRNMDNDKWQEASINAQLWREWSSASKSKN